MLRCYSLIQIDVWTKTGRRERKKKERKKVRKKERKKEGEEGRKEGRKFEKGRKGEGGRAYTTALHLHLFSPS